MKGSGRRGEGNMEGREVTLGREGNGIKRRDGN